MAQGTVPAAMKMLFTLSEGKSRMFPDPEGRGFVIVKVDKIEPGERAHAAGADRPYAERTPATRSPKIMLANSLQRCGRSSG